MSRDIQGFGKKGFLLSEGGLLRVKCKCLVSSMHGIFPLIYQFSEERKQKSSFYFY